MSSLAGKLALVLGRDRSAEAASALLARRGARVDWPAESSAGMTGGALPDLVVVSAGTCPGTEAARTWRTRGVRVIGERELAFQESLCLHVAVAGASGKTTTASLVAHLLRAAGRRVEVADAHETPSSAVVDRTRDLDFLVHAVEMSELEHLDFFRPVVAVVLNLPADFTDPDVAREERLRRFGRLFGRQQPFDWAILQSESLAQFQAAGVSMPGKVITFSASSRRADLGVDHGLLVSRLEDWAGLLWDLARSPVGLHFAEDVLAALAVGRVLRLGLEDMRHALDTWRPGPGRMTSLGEASGVRFIDDSCSGNPEALARALTTLAPQPPDQPFVWLIAGDRCSGRPLYDLGPVLSPRVRQAFLLGDAAGSMRGAWSLFVPCSPEASLGEATRRAIGLADRGDTILYSPGCPGDANLLPRQLRGEAFRQIVRDRLESPASETKCQSADPPGGPTSRSPSDP